MINIIRINLVVELVLCCTFVTVASGEDAVQERIRAGYMQNWNMDVLNNMGQSRMNLAMVKFGHMRQPIGKHKGLAKWAWACQEAGVQFMPVFNLWGNDEKNWIHSKYHLYYSGKELSQTPCPLEIAVYRKTVHNRMLELARLSLSVPIAGAIIDLEMYGGDISLYPDYCLCDYCFERFIAGRTVDKPLPLDRREDYLVKSKQLEDYRAFAGHYIEQLAQQTKEQVRSIAPNFVIGALLLDSRSTYVKGMAKGLGDKYLPVYVFSEQTYLGGYSDYIKTVQKRFSDEDIHAELVVGIWQNKFPLENLAEQYYHCAKNSAGYWIYTMESLSNKFKKSLPFDKAAYWRAIGVANGELSKLGINSKYKSRLRIRSFQAPPKLLETTDVIIPDLQYVRKADIRAGEGTGSNLRFRRKTTLVFVAEKGDELNFEVMVNKFGKNRMESAHVVLTDRMGNVLGRGLATLRKSAKVKVDAPYTGSYALHFDPDANSARVLFYSHAFSISTKQTSHLIAPRESLFFWQPAESSSAKITLSVDGFGESVTATFKNEAGMTLGIYDIVGRSTKVIPLDKSERGEIIELSIQPRPGAIFEDVSIKVESGLSSYISPFKNSLLHFAKR